MAGRREFFASLESLRGIAALLVVLFHIPAWNASFFTATFVRNGYLMVMLFFVLSGFVLAHSYGAAIASRADFRRFMVLRFCRLYPVHLVFLLGFLASELVKLMAAQHLGIQSINAQAFSHNTPRAFAEHLLLVQGLGFTPNILTFNAPAWSISAEFYTYVLFGLAAWLLPRGTMRWLAIFLVGAALTWIVAWPRTMGYFDGIVWCIAGFFLGVLLHEAYVKTRARPLAPYWDLIALCAVFGFLVLRTREGPAWDLPMLPLSALLVFALAGGRGPVDALLRRRPFTWLGERSYSLYMAHYLVIWVASQAWRVVFKAPNVAVDGMLHARLSLEQAALAYPATLAATLAVAALSYRYVEVPSRQWARQWAARSDVRRGLPAAVPEPAPAPPL